MSERNPVDPFSEITLEALKNTTPKKPKSPVEMDAIREVAIQSKFQSRQPAAKREAHTAKTFSLFPDDTAIIKNALRFFMDYNASIQASGSDVVRAALHEFAQKSTNEQVKLIEQQVEPH